MHTHTNTHTDTYTTNSRLGLFLGDLSVQVDLVLKACCLDSVYSAYQFGV